MKPSHMLILGILGGGFPAPALTAPADAAVINDTTPELTWDAVPGATTYTVQIATDAGFTAIVDEDTAVATNSYTSGALDPTAGPFYWRVKANPNGAWSEVRTFNHWIDAVNDLLPAGSLFHIFNDATTITNWKGNANLNGAVEGSPALVDGPLGTNQALELNANGERVRVANHADVLAIGNATTYTGLVRLQLNAANTNRRIHCWENSDILIQILTGDTVQARHSGGTVAQAITTNALTEGAVIWVAWKFNPADKALQFRIYTDGGTGTLAEMALSTDTAGVTRGTLTVQNMFWADRALGDLGMNASMWDIAIFAPFDPTLAQMQAIIDLIPA